MPSSPAPPDGVVAPERSDGVHASGLALVMPETYVRHLAYAEVVGAPAGSRVQIEASVRAFEGDAQPLWRDSRARRWAVTADAEGRAGAAVVMPQRQKGAWWRVRVGDRVTEAQWRAHLRELPEGPTVPDLDGDGVSDARERALKLDPASADSDGDGEPDAYDAQPTVAGPAPQIDDGLATEPDAKIPDPEVDCEGARIAWQTTNGSHVYVADLDRRTGLVIPPDGKGMVVDRGVSAMGVSGNGPEWVFGDGGPWLTYPRPDEHGHHIVVARDVGYSWEARDFDLQGFQPMGGVNARIRTKPPSGSGMLWRDLVGEGAGAVEVGHELWRPVPGGTHWSVPLAVDGTTQLHGVELSTGRVTPWTQDPGDKGDHQIWTREAGLALVTVVSREHGFPDLLRVYHQVDGVWERVLDIATPAGFPNVVSPELFHWKERAYVLWSAARGRRSYDGTVSQIWVASLDPARPWSQRVSLATPVQRKDPEAFVCGEVPWAYYSDLAANGGRARRLRKARLFLPEAG